MQYKCMHMETRQVKVARIFLSFRVGVGFVQGSDLRQKDSLKWSFICYLFAHLTIIKVV